ncbi:unnamed protein product [Staurois parvus]|uniref:Uncharacterized protein n=1 Tax=Staurois parvus TaxID=386267 RepID=A0ABN9B3I6_9NEOB|nr:unnamed protein product [Staurois parvus]
MGAMVGGSTDGWHHAGGHCWEAMVGSTAGQMIIRMGTDEVALMGSTDEVPQIGSIDEAALVGIDGETVMMLH